jgi:hypothetical protein
VSALWTDVPGVSARDRRCLGAWQQSSASRPLPYQAVSVDSADWPTAAPRQIALAVVDLDAPPMTARSGTQRARRQSFVACPIWRHTAYAAICDGMG